MIVRSNDEGQRVGRDVMRRYQQLFPESCQFYLVGQLLPCQREVLSR